MQCPAAPLLNLCTDQETLFYFDDIRFAYIFLFTTTHDFTLWSLAALSRYDTRPLCHLHRPRASFSLLGDETADHD